jgi:hypothetical protein
MADLGIEAITEEDRSYRGSTFREVVDAIFANPYRPVWGSENDPPFPMYEVTFGSLLRGIVPFASPSLFR